MQVVIPMSGLGSRFSAAGYSEIKPLISVMGRPMISWVCELFPGAEDFLFICREEHLLETGLRKVLNELKPNATIVAIPGHKKGPVHAINLASEYINDEDEVIVNYCDYFMDWNFAHFREFNRTSGALGVVPCYTGFHPHLLHRENKYAVCRTGPDGWVSEIREKHRFSENPEDDFHSAGCYYFKSGKLLKQLFSEMENRDDLCINGEWYVSLIYTLMIEKGMKVKVYDQIKHFCQWGTPADLQEFENWDKIMKHIKNGSVFTKNL
jgi:NDP-sugar pyrophosphorylase family protein